MLRKTKMNRIALAVAMSVGLATSAMAATGQSSAMSGVIVGPQGNPAANTTITIIHQPSGTVKEATVNGEGAFSARGLRVGGPYTIIVASDKFEGQVYENVYLELNETFELDTQLKNKSDVERITVTGSADFFANSGSTSVFSEDTINSVATFNRDLKDIVRANPLATVSPDGEELTIAGSNPKYNALTIDGVGIGDTFGLASNGYPSARPPISLDAVSQVSVEFAPFSARAGKFSGGNVNVVTKSGTNEFHGSAFYEFVPWAGTAKDDSYFTKDANDGESLEYDIDSEEKTLGLTFSGPLIKDKLFFFASYEKWEEDVEFDYNMDTLEGHNVTQDQVDTFLSTLSSVYGLEDSIGAAPAPDDDEKVLIKLDWNINSDHRADFTYSDQDTNSVRNYTSSDSTLNMNSNLYTLAQQTTFYTAHLYSDWTSDFNTEISLSYKDYKQASNTNSNWGEINVKTGTGTIVAGQDESRQANELANEVWNFAVHATYLLGDVELKAGFEIEDTWNYNLYGRDSAGTWAFDSLEEFANKAPSLVEYSNAYTNNIQDIAYDVSSTTYALYGEANFELFPDFQVSAGLRYEYLSVGDTPNLNSNFASTYGFDNTENLDGFDIFLPRVSFNWDVSEDLVVRGGVGRFSGGMPLVWVSNAYTNDGSTKDSVSVYSLDASEVGFTSVPQSLQDALEKGAGSTNSIDPDFKLPSDWRYQLGADFTFDIPGLGDNFGWTTELTYVDKQDAAFWKDISRVDNGNRIADGRIIWDSVYDGTDYEGNYDIMLTNSEGGHSTIISTALNKQWDNGFSFNASYTHQDVTEAMAGTSSTAESNYQYDVAVNRNIPNVGTAYYQIEHRLVLNLGYKHEFFTGYDTNFNLFVERRSGRPMSWTLGSYKDADFGDQSSFYSSGYYEVYLPSGADDDAFDFENGLSYEEIMEIASAAGVAKYAGGYIPKGAQNQPWVTTMDLAISQEVPGFVEGHKGKITFTIVNLANLINDDWGKVYRTEYTNKNLFDLETVDGKYAYQMPYYNSYYGQDGVKHVDTSTSDTFDTSESTWRVKIGVKYTF